MKILHTTDLHFNKVWFDWIAQQQTQFDIFCISGDFLESSKDETILDQIKWITTWIQKFNKPLFVCSGNHDIEELDNEEWLNMIEALNYYPDNATKRFNNIIFGCYPYVGADGYFEFDECDVLITHVPPAYTKTSINKNNNDWGDKNLYNDLKNRIINPKIILCGHIHNPVDTIDLVSDSIIYNPGVSQNTNIPNHHIIEI